MKRLKIKVALMAMAISAVAQATDIVIPSKIALEVGKSRQLNCVVDPADASPEITWSSSAPEIAEVSSTGLVTAMAYGKAEITATTQNGKQATCKVDVGAPNFDMIINLRNNFKTNVYHISDRPKIIMRNGSCLQIKSPGLIEDVDTMLFYKMTFQNVAVDRMPERIALESNIEMHHKDSLQLVPQLMPADYDIETELTWKSSDPDVVSVTADGWLKALYPGSADITVTASNGCSAVCNVTVPVPNYHMFVWRKDGTYDAYTFSTHPKMINQTSTIKMETDEGVYTYTKSDLEKITFGIYDIPVPSAVQAIDNDAAESLRQTGDHISMRGMKPDGRVYVYSIDGKLIATKKADANGTVDIRMSELAKGIYIVKTETISYKIMKK